MGKVSRTQAADIAIESLVGWFRPRMSVFDFGEAGCPRLNLYGFTEETLRGCWVVLIPNKTSALMSSEVVIVSKISGEIVYGGSANDEG